MSGYVIMHVGRKLQVKVTIIIYFFGECDPKNRLVTGYDDIFGK